ncbi:MAG: tyrosine-type recombinase/integrase [Aliiglaciecola sp.]|uniref:tyrosine-type recombinase/integrase n=1 Tax=Aliiglaciecola sp. TaxID=1872441 RepID=UPI0032976C1A
MNINNCKTDKPSLKKKRSQVVPSSMTVTAINKFLSSAEFNIGDALSSNKTEGLSLIKRKKGATFQLRVTIPGRGRKKMSLGHYNAQTNNFEHATMMALEVNQLIRDGKDPILEAEAKLEEIEKQLLLEKRKVITLGQYFEKQYLLSLAGKRSGKEMGERIVRHFEFLFNVPMSEIEHKQIEKWENKRLKAGIKRSTIKSDFGKLFSLLQSASETRIEGSKEFNYIDRNPLADFKLSKPTSEENDQEHDNDKEERRALTNEELDCLHKGLAKFNEQKKAERRNSRKHGKAYLPDLDLCTYAHWLVPFSETMLHTGLRQSDLYSLVWQAGGKNSIDLDKREIHVIPKKTRDLNNPAKILLQMSDELYDVIDSWHKDCGSPHDGFVFSNKSGGQHDRQAHKNLWKNIIKLGNFPNEIVMYSLRHNFISRLVSAGVPLLHIARLVGHKSIAMIEKHYGHLCPSDSKDILSKMSKTVARSSATESSATNGASKPV